MFILLIKLIILTFQSCVMENVEVVNPFYTIRYVNVNNNILLECYTKSKQKYCFQFV